MKMHLHNKMLFFFHVSIGLLQHRVSSSEWPHMTKVTSPYLLMLDSISDRFVTIKKIKKGSMIMVSGKCAGVVIYWGIYFI